MENSDEARFNCLQSAVRACARPPPTMRSILLVRLVELLEDVEIDRIGIARQDGENVADADLLALHFVEQAVGNGLFAHQAGGTGLDGFDAAHADECRGRQQCDHQREARHQHADDAALRDLSRDASLLHYERVLMPALSPIGAIRTARISTTQYPAISRAPLARAGYRLKTPLAARWN